MLILTRHLNEEITITDKETGKEIVIKVMQIRGSAVRIGIEAEKRFDIARDDMNMRPKLDTH